MYRQPHNLRLTRRGRFVLACIGAVLYIAAYMLSTQGRPAFDATAYDYYADSAIVFVGPGKVCPPYSAYPTAGRDGVCFPG